MNAAAETTGVVAENDPPAEDLIVDRQDEMTSRHQAAFARRPPWNVFAVSTHDDARLTDNAAMLSGRRRVIRMLVAVVAAFAVCVLPYHVRVLWQTFAEPQSIDDWQLVIPPLTFVVYYLNSAVNPLLYAFLSTCLATVVVM